jgi:hypothetical protein
MKRTGFVFLGGILFACTAVAQSPSDAQAQAGAQTSVQSGKMQAQGSGSASANASASAQNGQTNTALANGSIINAELNSPIDSKKAKQGDPVNARATEATRANGQTVIPKGAKLVGHVTQASARAKGDSESSLGIVFDKAILKHGEEVPLNATIQALATSLSSVPASAPADMAPMSGGSAPAANMGRPAGNATMGGAKSTASGAVDTVTNTSANAAGAAAGTVNATSREATNVAATERGAVGGLNSVGQLTSNSRGVFGLPGINLNSATAGAAQGSLITSAGKNVHLDGGTRMLLVTQAATTTEAPKP